MTFLNGYISDEICNGYLFAEQASELQLGKRETTHRFTGAVSLKSVKVLLSMKVLTLSMFTEEDLLARCLSCFMGVVFLD